LCPFHRSVILIFSTLKTSNLKTLASPNREEGRLNMPKGLHPVKMSIVI
jgi:hypothetical protein